MDIQKAEKVVSNRHSSMEICGPGTKLEEELVGKVELKRSRLTQALAMRIPNTT